MQEYHNSFINILVINTVRDYNNVTSLYKIDCSRRLSTHVKLLYIFI